MDIGHYLAMFAHDDKVSVVLILIAVDFVLGVIAAVEHGTFRLSYVADFMRRDVLGKVVPWFVLYAADKASHGASVVGPVDFGTIATGAFVAVTAALAGSILSSLKDLGVGLPTAVAGGEVPPPGP